MFWKFLLPFLVALANSNYFPTAYDTSAQKQSTIIIDSQPGPTPVVLPSYAELAPKVPDEQKKMVRYAFKRFRNTPGFDLLAHRLNKSDESTLMGALYELETAVHYRKDGYKILSFNQIKTSPYGNLCCEVDVEIKKGDKTCWVECKTSAWHNNVDKIKKQLLRQHEILTELNKSNQNTAEHMFCSQNEMPKFMKKWLRKHNISSPTAC